ncbi:TIGR04141 family sporadically distributed protein [Rhodobacteraceae bacterium LMO-12]|nr:TIGR04141 family sporadically distributed protein [Rhodobacteraceae bacterium LMO-JJ12]
MDDKDHEISQVSFFLAKPESTFDTVLDAEANPEKRDKFSQLEIEVGDASCRFIYFETTSYKKNPKWLDFVNTQIEDKFSFSAVSKNPNGVLMVAVDNRLLVAAFGRSSASLLDKKRLENDFGIRTAMNMCGNEEIRQTKSQSNTITTTQIDRQVSRPSDSFVFGLSEAEDLKYISAHMKGNNLITLQGKDRLTIKVLGKDKLTWEKLIDQCKEFLAAYSKEDFKSQFPNYRNFSPATEEEADQLDAALLNALRNKQLDKLQLCIPEFISDDDYSFSYSNKKKQENRVYSHLDITQLYDHLDMDKFSAKYLQNKVIYAYSLEEDRVLPYRKWSIYDCLLFEAKIGDACFILVDGNWARVEADFYNAILEFLQNKVKVEDCPDNCKNIPINDDKDMKNKEEIFNNKACEENPLWVKFDRAKLQIGTGRKDKEFCDILAMFEDGVVDIVHCKPLKDASSMNYLFSQAKFYGDAFLQDQVFLGDIRGHIEASTCAQKQTYLDHIKEEIEAIHGHDYRVRLWLLYDWKEMVPTIEGIPLIAKYEMMLMHDHMRRVCKFRDIIVSFVPVRKVAYSKNKKPKAA